MQRYWDLSEKERSELTSDQVESMLTVELMEKGIAKVTPLVLDPEENIELARETVFKVKHDSYSSFDCLFRSAEDAEAFINLRPLKLKHDYSLGSALDTTEIPDEPSIVPITLATPDSVASNKGRLGKIAATKKENAKRSEAHRAACKKVDEATSGVWEDWREQQSIARRCHEVLNTFGEYVSVCDGDKSKARIFLAKVYGEREINTAFEWLRPDDSEPLAVVAIEMTEF